jgi:hypothetical protein
MLPIESKCIPHIPQHSYPLLFQTPAAHAITALLTINDDHKLGDDSYPSSEITNFGGHGYLNRNELAAKGGFFQQQKGRIISDAAFCLENLVGHGGFEPPTPTSRT